MFYFGAHNPQFAQSLVLHVPFVSPSMFAEAHTHLSNSGLWGLCIGPMSGIPYKIYSIQAHEFGNLMAFLLISIPARLERLVISWGIFCTLGLILKKTGTPFRLTVHLMYWVGVYLYYWTAFAVR